MIQFNSEQERVIETAYNHVLRPTSKQVFQYSGKAGTGKTTVLREIIRRIGIPLHQIAIMTYIGQAATVMRTKGIVNARTAHSSLYRFQEVQVVDEQGNAIVDDVFNKPKYVYKFVPVDFDDDIKYIIIDEGGTYPMKMKYEVERRGLPIIVAGDINQLPAVADESAYMRHGEVDLYLNQIMRQGRFSFIPYLAEKILNKETISKGLYGDVLVIERDEVTDEMMANSNILICGRNKTRTELNNYVRKNILGIHAKHPVKGEKIICRKSNNRLEVDGINLTNGLIGRVDSTIGVTSYKDSKFQLDFKPDLLDSNFNALECSYKYYNATYEERMRLKSDPYCMGELFEPAYAITTHLSQGAQYPVGMYFKEFLNKDIEMNLDYTGATRFSDSLIYVLPPKKKYF